MIAYVIFLLVKTKTFSPSFMHCMNSSVCKNVQFIGIITGYQTANLLWHCMTQWCQKCSNTRFKDELNTLGYTVKCMFGYSSSLQTCCQKLHSTLSTIRMDKHPQYYAFDKVCHGMITEVQYTWLPISVYHAGIPCRYTNGCAPSLDVSWQWQSAIQNELSILHARIFEPRFYTTVL